MHYNVIPLAKKVLGEMESRNVKKVSIRLSEAFEISTGFRQPTKRADRKIAELMSILGFKTTITSSAGREAELVFEAKLPIQEIRAKVRCVEESEEYWRKAF
ncbi:MAG: hypothetical protein ACTSYM_10045 [Candidatus Baldrarchaeia archaeon]